MDPIVTSALIGGASSLFGSLFGDKGPSREEQMQDRKTIEQERYKWLVKGAQKAGFNPLTVLGAAGHTAGTNQTTPQSPLSWKTALGEAIKTSGQILATHDPVAAEGRKLDNQLKQRQITAFDNERNQQGGGTTPAGASSLEVVDETQRFPNLDKPVQSNFGTVDLGSMDGNDMRIDKGPLKNQYVVRNPLNPTKTYVLPKTFTPQEGIEGLAGDVGGEGYSFAQAIQMGRKTYQKLGIKEVIVHPRTGVVTPVPNSAQSRDYKRSVSGYEPKVDDGPQLNIGNFRFGLWKPAPSGTTSKKVFGY